MEKDVAPSRLHALDGLRGVAILLVILSHVNALITPRDSLWGQVLFVNGVLGVSFLFLLSGFLMAYLYPRPVSALGFLQKRYTRIFPLFITASLSLGILQFIPNFPGLSVFSLVVFAIVIHIIWVYGIKKLQNQVVSRALFLGFVLLQIICGLVYIWVAQHQPIFYYQQLSGLQRDILNTAVNTTLTLPFGSYVTMFDPVYWSLASEVIFYILYIFICVPIITFLSTKREV